jgi:NAD(P)-dependent dehydrogenase (short-subunit alcohol dehydrogenase family)
MLSEEALIRAIVTIQPDYFGWNRSRPCGNYFLALRRPLEPPPNGYSSTPAVQEVVQTIRTAGGVAVACVGSVTAPDFAERFVGTAINEYKGLDIIVDNAGYTWDNVIQKMTDEQWYAMIDCHLTAPFRRLRAAQPVIRALAKAEAEADQRIVRKVGKHLVRGRLVRQCRSD